VKNQALYQKLHALRIDINGFQLSPSIPDLISLMKNDPKRWEPLFLEEMKKDNDPLTLFKEFIVLLKGTGKTEYLDSMFALAARQVSSNGESDGIFKDGFFWCQLGCTCAFDSIQKFEIVKRVVGLIKTRSLSPNYAQTMINGLSNYPSASFQLEKINKELFLDLILIIRKNLFTGANPKLVREYRGYLDVAGKFAPFAFVVFFSELMDKENGVIAENVKEDFYEQRETVSSNNRNLQVPASFDIRQWRDWKLNHGQLHQMWMYPDLESLRRLPTLDYSIVGRNR
jgi:hypothetical protein